MRINQARLGDRLAGSKLVFFDCDGVLLDSNGVKLAAVEHALAAYPSALRERCKVSFKLNFGRSRRWHFEAFESLAGTAAEADFVSTSIARYEHYLQQHYSAAPPVAGAARLLQQLADCAVKCVVISGGNEKEINLALAANGMDHYLARIIGSPVAKAAAIRTLLEQYDCTPGETVFLGDAIADAEAAIVCNVPFLFVSGHALVKRDALSQCWPVGHWAGEVENLQPDAPITRFNLVAQTIQEDS